MTRFEPRSDRAQGRLAAIPREIGVEPDLRADQHVDEGLERDRDERGAEQVDDMAMLERAGERGDQRLITLGAAVAAAQHLHAEDANQVERKPTRERKRLV